MTELAIKFVILYRAVCLQELEVNVHGNPTPSWMICSAIPLPKGSSLGPFAGDMVSSDNIRVGDLIVEVSKARS